MKTTKILIVDDSFDSRLIIKSALRSKMYTMLEATNGETGVRMAIDSQPDLIIMDVMMPGMSGYEALQEIKKHPLTQQIPVLVVTALGSMEEQIIALEKGAEALFGKPFERHALVEHIEAIIGSSFQTLKRHFFQKQELLRYYYNDALTGLPLRSQLIKDLKSSQHQAMILIDIDRFKDIVYFFGHEVGDSCLKKVGEKVSQTFSGEGFTTYRIAGDLFVLLIQSCMSEADLQVYIDLLNERLNLAYVTCQFQEIQLRTTFGASFGQKDLLISAEKALATAKELNVSSLIFDDGKVQFQSFDKNIYWSQKIREAIEDDRIVPFFQPIINVQNDTIEKYECLVRLIDKEQIVCAPILFLEISKKSRSYAEITKSMISKSFEMFKSSPYFFSINLSVKDIINSEISDYIFMEIERFSGRDRVIFELLESEGIENYDAVYTFITKAKEFGCKIAIDDFGSGYSNFIHLLRLDVDIIKIDGSLIRDLDKDENARIIVQTIIDFSKKLNILTVAEFVHNETIYAIVKELGVDYAQGYHLGKPKESLI